MLDIIELNIIHAFMFDVMRIRYMYLYATKHFENCTMFCLPLILHIFVQGRGGRMVAWGDQSAHLKNVRKQS